MSVEYPFPVEKYLLLGKVVKAQGLQGEIKVVCYSGQPDNFKQYKTVFLVSRKGQISSALKVESFRPKGASVVLKLENINSRSDSEAVEDAGVLLRRTDLASLKEEEFYWHQYEGKSAVTVSGESLGIVTGLFHNGAQDVLIIKKAERELLIPVTKDTVIGLQKQTAELVLNPPSGLLEVYSDEEGQGKA